MRILRAVVAGAVLVSLLACDGRSTPSPSGRSTTSPTTGAPATQSSGSGQANNPDMAARLGTALSAGREEIGAPGAQAAVVFADGSMWTGASGVSTPGTAMSSDLLFAIASVTKVYTATMILALAEEGVLRIDDPLLRWVPDAANGEGVTIGHLLTHTSGIASDDPTLPRVCEPGTCYSYSNAGYGYLGRVIEVATASTYAAQLHARITTPLGLTETFYPHEEPVRGIVAIGHKDGEEGAATAVITSRWAEGWQAAAGGILTTSADLARFGHALFTGAVLPDAALARLLDVDATRGLPGTTECIQQAMLDRGGGSLGMSWRHGGNLGSFRAWLEHYPAYGLTIAVTVNGNPFPGPIADRLAAVAIGDAARPPQDGRCATDIGVRAPDGTTRRLGAVADFVGMPAWSADGDSIAWIQSANGQNDIVVGRADGSGVERLTNDAGLDVRPGWSPDGTSIVFSSNRDGDHEIYVIAVADRSVTQLTDNTTDDWAPAWSPDGSRIAYVATDGAQHLQVMAADGSDSHRVDGPDARAWWPAWSPDGRRLAYEADGVIFIVPVTGGTPVRLAVEQLRVVRLPTWAPATDIAFSSDADIYAAAPDGSNVRRLTSTSSEEGTPAWAPDGSLAFSVSYWLAGSP
jgi:CubicO group peptidase (beta-lactamase class C family)/Tol biopolymer transport system component